MQVYTLPDITPNGSVINLGTKATAAGAPTSAIFVAMTAVGTSIRTGDSNIGAARGVLLSVAATVVPYPRQDNMQRPYDLNTINVYGGSGSDKVTITYGI